MGWVIAQAILFALIIILPIEGQFSLPMWAKLVAGVLSALGVIVGLRAVYDLRRSLAIRPIPREDGQLQTSGIYGWVRHPMYISVWLIMGGGVVRSGSYAKIALFAALIVFFILKVRYEEKLLKQKYPDYAKYAQKVGGFFPRITDRVTY